MQFKFPNWRRGGWFAYAAQITLAGVVAVALGLFVAKKFGDHAREQRRQTRYQATQQIITKMGTIAVGETLPDSWFLLDDSTSTRLSSLICSTTIVSFIELGCEACISELEAATSLERNLQDRILFISHDDPRLLAEIRARLGFYSRILYDPGGRYQEGMSVMSFPFGIVIDGRRSIVQILAGSLNAEEFKSVL